jgi:tetratricopeptide (TPR) repeat protein
MPLRTLSDFWGVSLRVSLVLSLILLATMATGSIPSVEANSLSSQLDHYADLQTRAQVAYNQGQLSQAIQLYEESAKIVPPQYADTCYNNLAVAYIKRGLYHQKANQLTGAIADFQNAYFLMDMGWPFGVTPSASYQQNKRAASENLINAYKAAKQWPLSPQAGLTQAQTLRQQGKFREAIVVYSLLGDSGVSKATVQAALGDLYTVINRPDKAEGAFLKAAQDGKHPQIPADELWMRAGLAQKKNAKYQEAVDSFNKAAEINPNNQAALAQLEGVWREELKASPQNILAHANLAMVFQKQKRYPLADQAYRVAESLMAQNPTVPTEIRKMIRMNYGTFFEDTNQIALAEQAYQSVLQLDRANTEAQNHLLELYLKSNQPIRVIEMGSQMLGMNGNERNEALHATVLKAIRSLPNAGDTEQALEAYANRFSRLALVEAAVGETYHQGKNYEAAIRHYRNAVKLDPKDDTTWANLGLALKEAGRTSEATEALRQATLLNPNNTQVSDILKTTQEGEAAEAYNQGVALLQQPGQETAGLPLLQKAVRLEPNNRDYRFAMGAAYQQLKRYPEAIDVYSQGVRQFPSDAEFYYARATAYQASGQGALAKADYQKTLALNPANAEAKTVLAGMTQQESAAQLQQVITLYESKQYAKALQSADLAIQKDPNNSDLFYYKGLTLEQLKKLPLAIGSYERAIALDPTLLDAYYALGLAYEQSKQPARAAQTYEQFITRVQADTNPEQYKDYVEYAQSRLLTLKK